MDFGRNLEAKEQWTIEHLKKVVLPGPTRARAGAARHQQTDRLSC